MGLFNAYIHYLPLLLIALITVTFVTTYSIAVKLKHVYHFWPYISDTGTFPPESCIFSFLLNMTCFLLIIIIYVRHRQVSAFTKIHPSVRITKVWNIVASVTGYVGTFGLAVVASFQETNLFLVHILGAFFCFIFSTIYFFFHCIFTYRMKNSTKLIFSLRVLYTCINVITFITIFAPLNAAIERFKGEDMMHWKPKDGGHHLHLLSTISEWILVLSFGLYVCTFFPEFKSFEITSPKIRVSNPNRPWIISEKAIYPEKTVINRDSLFPTPVSIPELFY